MVWGIINGIVTFNNGITLSGGQALNSIQQATANTGNTLVRRDASGNFTAGAITATSFSGSGASLTSIPNSATTATSANTASAIVARDASGNFTAGALTLNQILVPATVSSASDSQATALSYGRLQGFGTFYINGDTDGSGTEPVIITSGYSVANGTAANGLSIGQAAASFTWRNNTIWHAGNDGPNSNLNADLLDDQEGSYYRDASNLNAGTVPTARLGSGTANNTTFLRGDQTWQTVISGVSITDETTNATRYIAFTTAASGTTTSINVSSSRLTYNPSTSVLFTDGSVEIGATDSGTQKFSINFNETTDSLDFTYTA